MMQNQNFVHFCHNALTFGIQNFRYFQHYAMNMPHFYFSTAGFSKSSYQMAFYNFLMSYLASIKYF